MSLQIPAITVANGRARVGTQVQTRCGSTWQKGEVLAIQFKSGTVQVAYDDGDLQTVDVTQVCLGTL